MERLYNLFCLLMLYLGPLVVIIAAYTAIVVVIVNRTRAAPNGGECQTVKTLDTVVSVIYEVFA